MAIRLKTATENRSFQTLVGQSDNIRSDQSFVLEN